MGDAEQEGGDTAAAPEASAAAAAVAGGGGSSGERVEAVAASGGGCSDDGVPPLQPATLLQPGSCVASLPHATCSDDVQRPTNLLSKELQGRLWKNRWVGGWVGV